MKNNKLSFTIEEIGKLADRSGMRDEIFVEIDRQDLFKMLKSAEWHLSNIVSLILSRSFYKMNDFYRYLDYAANNRNDKKSHAYWLKQAKFIRKTMKPRKLPE